MKKILFILWVWPCCVMAQEAADNTSKLQALTAQIQTLASSIAGQQDEQEDLQQELRALDLQVAASSKTVQETKITHAQNLAALKKLEAQYTQEEKALNVQQGYIKQQVRSAYLLGQFEALKLLLNQTDANTVGRTLVYFNYFNAARSEIMHTLQDTLNALTQKQATILDAQQDLKTLAAEQDQAYAVLTEQKQAREAVALALSSEISEKNLTLESLQADKQALESVIVQLPTQSSPVFIGSVDKPFATYKGQLPWPVQGTLQHRFGEAYLVGNKWQGIFIAAAEGSPVQAIYPGRVVYADWLRGFGLITIIDHGDGYMSLYAHNQSLYKSAGETVNVNEPIAQVGKSGSVANTGLYFEIRSKGEVQNPLPWLQKSF